MSVPSAAKYAIGQPVLGSWDCKGATLGVVYAQAWCEAPHTARGGFWRYWVRQSNGGEYNDMEDLLSGARLDGVYLRRNLKVIKREAA